jgi:putative redox protein
MTEIKTAELTFTGGMHFEAELGSGAHITFDDSSKGGPGPIETVLAALAACSAMDVVSIALKKRQALERYAIHARAEQRADYPQVFTVVELVHEVEGSSVDVAAIRRCIELSAEKYCPVNAMLSAGATEVHHRYRVIRGDAPPDEGEVMVTGPDRRPDIIARAAGSVG